MTCDLSVSISRANFAVPTFTKNVKVGHPARLSEVFCASNIDVYTSIAVMNRPALPTLPCMCGSLRRTARALTQLYEEELRPLGLRATQLTILQMLWRAGELSQGTLGEFLAMDSTSLTRTLAIMIRKGWIAERRGEDRRERWLRLSKAGQTKLNRALPAWEKVQLRLLHQIGDQAWKSLMQLATQITTIAGIKGDPS